MTNAATRPKHRPHAPAVVLCVCLRLASCLVAALDVPCCPACRACTARCAAPPSGRGILEQGFDLCRASHEAAEFVSDDSSSSPNALLTDLVSPENQVSTMAPDANWRLLNNAGRRRSAALVPGRNCTNIDGDRDGATAPEPLSGVQGEGGLLPPSRAIGRLLSLRSSLDIHQRSGAGGGRRVSRLRSEADP